LIRHGTEGDHRRSSLRRRLHRDDVRHQCPSPRGERGADEDDPAEERRRPHRTEQRDESAEPEREPDEQTPLVAVCDTPKDEIAGEKRRRSSSENPARRER